MGGVRAEALKLGHDISLCDVVEPVVGGRCGRCGEVRDGLEALINHGFLTLSFASDEHMLCLPYTAPHRPTPPHTAGH